MFELIYLSPIVNPFQIQFSFYVSLTVVEQNAKLKRTHVTKNVSNTTSVCSIN